MSLLGLDVGATRCVAVAYSAEGARLAQSVVGYRPSTTRQGAVELDLLEVWQGLCQAIGSVVEATVSDPIRALSVCSRGEGLVALGADGQPLGPCLLAVPQQRQPSSPIYARMGVQRFFEITGRQPGDHEALDLWAWLLRERPGYSWGLWRVVPLGVFAAAALGGTTICEPSMAGAAFPLDVVHRSWSRDLLELYNLNRQLLPDLAEPGISIGSLSARAAEETNLSREVSIVLGGLDISAQALGAGVVEPGLALLDLGTSLRMEAPFQAIPLTSLMLGEGLAMVHHVVPGLFLSRWESPHGERLLRWFRDNLAPLEKKEAERSGTGVYDLLFSEMPEGPTSLLALPSSCGPEGAERRGAILGIGYGTTRGEIVKALLESIACQCLGALQSHERAGIRVTEFCAVGGGARSPQWLQLCADVLGTMVHRTQTHETASLGAALLAGLGTGVYSSPEEAVRAAVHVRASHVPDEGRNAIYGVRAKAAAQLAEGLQELMDRLWPDGNYFAEAKRPE